MALSTLELDALFGVYGRRLTSPNSELKTLLLADMLPGWYNTEPGTRLFAVLKAIGEADANLSEVERPDSTMSVAKQSLFVGTATGAALGVNGQNYGISRPQSAQYDDEMYRRLIQAIAYAPRGSLKTIYDVVAAFLGPQSEAGWQIFDPGGNLIVIWSKSVVDVRNPATATYLHADASIRGGPTDILAKYPGDYFLSDTIFDGKSEVVREGTTGGIIPGPQGTDASMLVNPYPHISLPSAPFTGLYSAATGDVFVTLSGAAEEPLSSEFWNRINQRQATIVQTTSTVLSFDNALVVKTGDVVHPELDSTESFVGVPVRTPTYVVPTDPLLNTDVHRLLTNHPHKLGSTPTTTKGALLGTAIPPPSGNGTILWKLGDIFTSVDNLFLPDDVGSTIVITFAASPLNNRTAKVIGYIDANHVVITAGDTPLTADVNNGLLHWKLYRGVLDNIVVLTGNRIIQDLYDTLALVKMAGVVVRIGDVTT